MGTAIPNKGTLPELALQCCNLTAQGFVTLSSLIQLSLQLPAVCVDTLRLFLSLLQLPFQLLESCVALVGLKASFRVML